MELLKTEIRLKLPEKFIRRIQLTFKEQGTEWLGKLSLIMRACADKWQLTDIEPVKELSYNLVCSANSSQYGSIILKLCAPNAGHEKEAAVLSYYHGQGICHLYDYDHSLGALLLERMETMDDLRSVGDFTERVCIAARMTYEMPKETEEEMYEIFPVYADWTKRAFRLVQTSPLGTEILLGYVKTAEKFMQELSEDHRPQMLLHGDLHHMNILQNRDGFTAIDPKGVIGVRPQNAVRFIENELQLYDRTPQQKEQALHEMLVFFSEVYDEKTSDLFKYLYIDIVLSTTWFTEDGVMTEYLKNGLMMCKLAEKFSSYHT